MNTDFPDGQMPDLGPPGPATPDRWRLLAVAAIGVVTALAVIVTQVRGQADTHGSQVVRDTVLSDQHDRYLEQVWVLPPGFERSDRRGLLVLLHGRGDSPAGRANPALTAALADAGDRAPVVLIANGGDHSYYHDRDDGPWGSYIVRELIPSTIERFGVDGSRVVFAGISMGGFGALELTRASGARACAVAALAPALWHDAAQTPEGAFDDAADFAEHDVLGAATADPAALHGTPLYLAVGEDDPFLQTTTELASALQRGQSRVLLRIAPGGHDAEFWDGHIDEVVRWAVDGLADC